MIVVGVILLLLVVAIVALMLILGSGSDARVLLTWDAVNLQWSASALTIFALGAVSLALLVVSLVMIRSGAKRGMHKSQEMRRLRKIEQETGEHPQVETTGHKSPRNRMGEPDPYQNPDRSFPDTDPTAR